MVAKYLDIILIKSESMRTDRSLHPNILLMKSHQTPSRRKIIIKFSSIRKIIHTTNFNFLMITFCNFTVNTVKHFYYTSSTSIFVLGIQTTIYCQYIIIYGALSYVLFLENVDSMNTTRFPRIRPLPQIS